MGKNLIPQEYFNVCSIPFPRQMGENKTTVFLLKITPGTMQITKGARLFRPPERKS